MTRETREAAEYREEVREYIEKAPLRFELLARKHAVDIELAPVSLAVDNQTEINFPRTQVTLRLPGNVRAFFDSGEIEDDLEDLWPPLPWGEHGIYAFIPPRIQPVVANLTPKDHKVDIDDGQLVVVLSPVDVRPRTKHDLETVHLVVPESYAGGRLEIQWRATSTGAAGDASGSFEVPIEDAVDADELVVAEEAEAE